MLQVRLLGRFDVRLDGMRVNIPSRAGQSLFAYLVLTAGTPHRREKLAGLFWPDTLDENARKNLRQELWRIRKAISSKDAAGADYFLSEDFSLSFNPAAEYWLDVAQFERSRAEQDSLSELTGRLGLYQGELLPGFYDDWVVLERERLQSAFEARMQELLEWLLREQRWPAVLEWAERWIAQGHAPEPAYRACMVAFASQGNHARIVEAYERCRQDLEKELGVEPGPETQALYEQLLSGQAPTETVSRVVRSPVSLLDQPPAPGASPFKGLQYFDESDADLFFGRELAIARLAARLAENAFLAVVVGASGSGKSSIVRAGLIPALKRGERLADGVLPPTGSEAWDIRIMTPTAHPLQALASVLTREENSLSAALALADDLARDPRALQLYVDRRFARRTKGEDGRTSRSRLVLAVDQFEELFTLCHDEFEREAFIDNLVASILPGTPPLNSAAGTTLILTLRADFYAHLAQYPELREAVAGQQEYIGPMSADELRRSVEEPARRASWEFEPGLVDLILRDVGTEPGALPLLSHALLETWKRRSGRMLTLKGYAESGGVRGAIAQTAETLYQELAPEQQVIARNIFLRLTELGEGTEDTRRRAVLSELVPAEKDAHSIRQVIQLLADARLITTGEGTVEVAHEALIREWPRLREWLNQDREGLRLHRQLSEAAHDWELLDRDPGVLYRGMRLVQASEWASVETNAAQLNALERSFLQASKAQAQREESEHEAQRQRELESALKLAEAESQRAEVEKAHAQTTSRAAAQLRRGAVILAAAFVLALIMAGAALYFGGQARSSAATAQTRAQEAEAASTRAESERRIAISRELSEAALNNLDQDPERSILLALQAVTTTYSVDRTTTLEAENALHRAIQASRVQLTLPSPGGDLLAVAFSPDGARLATGGEDKQAHVWDAATGKELLTLGGFGDAVWSLSFSPDGARLTAAGADGTVQAWEAATGQVLSTIHEPRPSASALSADGRRIAMVTEDGMIRVWDTGSGQELFSFSGAPAAALALSRDGAYLAAARENQTVQVWNVATGQSRLNLPVSADAVAFSANDKYLATADANNRAEIWDLAGGEKLFTLTGHSSLVYNLTFSLDSTRLATAGLDGTAKVWDVATGKLLLTLSGHKNALRDLSFSPDGKRLATASSDRTARIWDVSEQGGGELLVLAGHADWVKGATFSPDGARVASASTDGTAKVWDAVTGQVLLTLTGHQGRVFGIAYSPDGARIATAGEDRTGRIWDARTGQELLTLSGHGDGTVGGLYKGVLAVRFSPDGKRVATAGADKTARIWDAVTGRELLKLEGHQAGVTNVAFSPDGKRIATTGDDALVKIWDATTGQELLTLTGHQVRVWGIDFSPDGKRLATSGFGGIVKIWDSISGQEVMALSGHVSTVNAIKYSPDGKRLVTAGTDVVKVWDATTGTELVTLTGHSSAVLAAVFSPDGSRLVTASLDTTLRVYALRIEELVSLAKTRITRSLTDDECQKYLHVQACPPLH